MNKDCKIKLKNGTLYEFSYTNIDKAIKWAFENGYSYIETPHGVLSLIDKDTYLTVSETVFEGKDEA